MTAQTIEDKDVGNLDVVTGEILPANKSVVMGSDDLTTRLNDDVLSDVTSFEDALRLVRESLGGSLVDAGDVLGTGFAVLEGKEKDAFIGSEFVVLMVTKNPSDKSEKGYFYSLTCVAVDGRKFILNDGSTGIADQLDKFYAKHPDLMGKPMRVKKGLRASRYTHPDHGACVTYYLDTSK